MLTKSQEIIYLGFLINSKLMMLYLHEEKWKTIIEEYKMALPQDNWKDDSSISIE